MTDATTIPDIPLVDRLRDRTVLHRFLRRWAFEQMYEPFLRTVGIETIEVRSDIL